MLQGPRVIGSTIFLLVQSDAKDQGHGEDWTFTHDLDISQDLFDQIAREYPLDTWCRLMAYIAGAWSMLYDPQEDPPEGRSPAEHARAQLADLQYTLPGRRGTPGGLRLDLIHDPPSQASASSSDSDEPHTTLADNLAALLSLQ